MKLRQMPFYERDAQGQKVKRMSSKWYAVFVDWSEALRRLPLLDDKKASTELARKIDRLNSIRAGGDMMTADLTRYVETMPPGIRTKLAEWGILSAARVAAGKPLTDHVADWKRALLAKGNTPRHAELVTSRAANAFDSCGFRLWTDISASKLQSHLADLRADRRKADDTVERGISAQTYNFYLQAAKQFCRWMVRDGRASESPLVHLQGLNVKTDRRHDRRALSPDEMRWLLDVTAKAPERYGMRGEARAMLYRLAVETGLRAGELRSLTRGSFALEGDEPSVTIAAAYAKNRRQDTLPLKTQTAALLAKHFTGKMPQAQAFSLPIPNALVDMIRADLASARQEWIEDTRMPQEQNDREQSSFLAYCDEAVRKADFHALRHTFISNLAAGGVHPKTAQSLARHSTITLTMDRYSHVYRGELGKALDVLPNLSSPTRQAAIATGTDGKSAVNRLSPDLSLDGEFRRSPVQSSAVNAVDGEAHCEIEKPSKNEGFPQKNGEAGIRTRDTSLTPYNGLANRRLQPLGHLSCGPQKVNEKR